MGDNELHQHFVCTLDEARKIVDEHEHLWVSDCNCRDHRGPCKRSRLDVCLQFAKKTAASGAHKKKVTRAVVEKVFEEAREKHLVPRPFRNDEDKSKLDGICFCCDDCCGYFLGLHEPCDKGDMIETTNMNLCENCGACVGVCHFGARKSEGDRLVIDRDMCYGCGLCVDVCSMDCIKMVKKK